MFDKNYFNDILQETMNLIKKEDKTKKDSQKIKYNTKTLMILLDEIENENKRMRYASKIENYLQLKLKERKIDVKEESNNPVNKDILKFSKQLKQRVTTFNKILEDDEDVVQSVHSNYSEQITQTESNIKNLDKIDTSSVSRGFITVILIFIIMYVFIRTF